MKELTEQQIIRSLRRLEKGWPKKLWIFSVAGTLHLMDTDQNGDRVYRIGSGGLESRIGDGVDPSLIIASFHGIPNDGGDW